MTNSANTTSSATTATDEPTRKIDCPHCGTKTSWSQDNPHRPFCSESCRNHDFVSWAKEEHVMSGNSAYDDFLSGELDDGEVPLDF